MTPLSVIDQALRRFDRRRRRVAAARATLVGVSAAAGWVLLAAIVDRWLHFSVAARVACESITGLLLVATAARSLLRLIGRGFDPVHTSRQIENVDAEWDDRLITVVTQARLPPERRASVRLNAVLAAAVASEVAERPPVRRVPVDGVARAAVLLAIVGMGWLTLFWSSSSARLLMKRQLMAMADVPAVTSMRIDLMPHATSVAQGQSLTITADLAGGSAPAVLHVGPTLHQLRAVPMERSYAGRFTATLLSLQNDLVYRVTAGDATAGPVTVKVLRRPGVIGQRVALDLPDGRQQTAAEGEADIRVPTGTKVRLSFRVTDPLRSAVLRSGGTVVAAVPGADRRSWEARFVVTGDAVWELDLVGENGMQSTVERALTVHADGTRDRRGRD